MTLREYAESKNFVITGTPLKTIRQTCQFDFAKHKSVLTKTVYWTDEAGNTYTKDDNGYHIITADGMEI